MNPDEVLSAHNFKFVNMKAGGGKVCKVIQLSTPPKKRRVRTLQYFAQLYTNDVLAAVYVQESIRLCARVPYIFTTILFSHPSFSFLFSFFFLKKGR